MKRTSSLVRGGFTLIELLVVIAIIALLASLSIPAVGGAITKAQLAQAVSNARQIHIATTGAGADANAQGDDDIGWPADTGASTAGDFIQSLLDGGYLKFGDLKVFGAGRMTYDGQPPFDPANDCGFSVYNLGDSDEGSAIFLSTRNANIAVGGDSATLLTDADSNRVFGNKGFVVFRKGGDGTYYLKAKNSQGNYGTDPVATPRILGSGGSVSDPNATP